MPADLLERDDIALLPPFPEGWYFVGTRRCIQSEGLIQKTWMNEEIVAWCAGNGRICVAEAICPHLGSELGPAAGGRVRNGHLICPFHGFEYDATGRCVATPYAPAPVSARLRIFETCEVTGLVFAWWGSGGRPPQWSLPGDPPAGDDWSEPGFRTIRRFPGHPQETTENAVDIAHLRYVHGYGNVSRAGSVSVDGPRLESSFDFTRTTTIAGMATLEYDISAVAHVFGLGYSYVEIRERSIGMDARLWVLATPVDGTLIDLVLVGQVRKLIGPKRPIVGMRFLPLKLRTRLMNEFVLSAQKRDVMQDVAIWGRKRYRPRPRLCGSDGEFGLFRRYCEQFYPERGNAGPDRAVVELATGI